MFPIAILMNELISSKAANLSKQESLQNDILISILTASSYRNHYYLEHLSVAASINFRFIPSKHFDVASKLSSGCMTLRRGTTSNQRWNNIVYLNVGIYNVEQRRINVAYFNVDVNNVRQRRNNIVLFNFKFYNVCQRGSNVVKMTIYKKEQKKNHFKLIHLIQSFNCHFIILFTLLPILRGKCWRILAKLKKLRSWEKLRCKNLI